jgi:hypothetical protein
MGAIEACISNGNVGLRAVDYHDSRWRRLKKIVHRRRRRSPPPQETIAYETRGVEAFTNGLISLVDLSHFARQPSSSVYMWALWVREWGHMATSRPLRASNQIVRIQIAADVFFKKKGKKKRNEARFVIVLFLIAKICYALMTTLM